jgi:hypothetical protein
MKPFFVPCSTYSSQEKKCNLVTLLDEAEDGLYGAESFNALEQVLKVNIFE